MINTAREITMTTFAIACIHGRVAVNGLGGLLNPLL